MWSLSTNRLVFETVVFISSPNADDQYVDETAGIKKNDYVEMVLVISKTSKKEWKYFHKIDWKFKYFFREISKRYQLSMRN